MPVYRLRERVLNVVGAERPHFPCDVALNVRLAPEVPFGGVVGPTRNAVGDAKVKARLNLSTARVAVHPVEPLFDYLDVSMDFGRGTFHLRGSVVTVEARCADEGELEGLIATLSIIFPAVVSVYLPDAPHATHAWGRLDGREFKVEYDPTDVTASLKVTSKQNQEDLVAKSWTHALRVAQNRRLSVGCQYFHTACRLLQVGHNRFEFTAEALLNFAKSLQAICGDTRDKARARLKLLGYTSGEADGRFIPAMVLRDQFDVAHIALSSLSREELRVLHDYTDIAESAFRELLTRVLTEHESGRYEPPASDIGQLSKDKVKILRRLAGNIAPFVQR